MGAETTTAAPSTQNDTKTSGNTTSNGETTTKDESTEYVYETVYSDSDDSSNDTSKHLKNLTPAQREKLKKRLQAERRRDRREAEKFRKHRLEFMRKVFAGTCFVASEVTKAGLTCVKISFEAIFTCADVTCIQIKKMEKSGCEMDEVKQLWKDLQNRVYDESYESYSSSQESTIVTQEQDAYVNNVNRAQVVIPPTSKLGRGNNYLGEYLSGQPVHYRTSVYGARSPGGNIGIPGMETESILFREVDDLLVKSRPMNETKPSSRRSIFDEYKDEQSRKKRRGRSKSR